MILRQMRVHKLGTSTVRLSLALVLIGLLIASGAVGGKLRDRHQFVDAQRLGAALRVFRPPGRAGLPATVEAAALLPERSARVSPDRCRALALLNRAVAEDGGSWSGINGSPAEPVSILTVRLASAQAARSELRAKRLALVSCTDLWLTFPPFGEPAKPFKVDGRLQPTLFAGDAVSYSLVGQDSRYTFYIRRYGNTLTWAYGAKESQPAIRREVVDDLARTFAEMAAE